VDTRFERTSPLLVIGMHRSGTRLLAGILDKLGVFMGADRQGDGESVTFMLINEAIFHQCGTFWSEPMPLHFVLSQPESVERLAASVRETLAAKLTDYAGASGWRLGSGAEDTPSFGWKDPRNTFTLPVWRRVFPHLRALHIVRHGVDVAASLARRQSAALRSATGESVPSALTVIKDHAFGVLSSRRGWTLAEALTMWEQYVEKARLEAAELGKRALEIRFEDLLTRRDAAITRIARFCEVPVPRDREAILEHFEPARAFAYRREPELVDFAETVRDILHRYGYNP
jgi:hypothetical protein